MTVLYFFAIVFGVLKGFETLSIGSRKEYQKLRIHIDL
jgi:hypothetical protein